MVHFDATIDYMVPENKMMICDKGVFLVVPYDPSEEKSVTWLIFTVPWAGVMRPFLARFK